MTVAARAAVALQLDTITAAGWAGLAVQHDPNRPFTPPQDAPWLRVVFQDGDEQQVGIGGVTNPLRTSLIALIDVFAPAGSGDGDAVAIAEIIKTGFRRWQSGGIRWSFNRAGVEGRGQGADVALYRKQIVVVFTLSHRG